MESQRKEVGDFLRDEMVDPDGSGGVGIRQPQGDLHNVPGGPEARSLGRRHELDRPWYKICADLFKVLGMPRTLQRYLEGGKYVTISNIDLAVCGMLQTLALVQANDSVRPAVRV